MAFEYDGLRSDNARSVVAWAWQFKTCLYCTWPMRDLGEVDRLVDYDGAGNDLSRETVEVHICPRCGWWAAKSPYINTGGHIMAEVGYGALKVLDVTDVSAPVDEVRSHLVLKPEDFARIDPKLLEDVVGSIFRSFGYHVRVTSYRADGGIDAYLDGSDDTLVGVQVKRVSRAVEIEQINALTGALFVNDCSAGVFVTTSRFRSGVYKVAGKARARGLPIELFDSARLYGALQIAQLGQVREPDDPKAPWMSCHFKESYKEQ